MRRTAKRGLAAAITIAALGAAGCGGDDDSGAPDGGGKALSKSDFVARADRACAGSGLKPAGPYKDAKHAAAGTAAQIRTRRELDRTLDELEPPAELEPDFRSFQEGTDRMVAALQRAKAAADREQEPKFAESTKAFDAAGREREKAADRIGFKRCGQPLQAPK